MTLIRFLILRREDYRACDTYEKKSKSTPHGTLETDRHEIEVVREKVERSDSEEENTPVKIEDSSEIESLLTLDNPKESIKSIN